MACESPDAYWSREFRDSVHEKGKTVTAVWRVREGEASGAALLSSACAILRGLRLVPCRIAGLSVVGWGSASGFRRDGFEALQGG
jgi:hypothetical protein